MAQAIVDPAQLRQFAMHLKRFTAELSDNAGRLGMELSQLGATWRDQENRKFAAEFEEQMKQIKRLIEASEQHVPYLLRKAELVEEYLRQ